MLKINGQRGSLDRFLLFAFVMLFIIVFIALPKFLKWQTESKIPGEVLNLRRIHAAQTKYQTKISLKNTFASFKQLEDTKQLPETCADCDENVRQLDGFRFDLSRNYEETRFCVRVTGTKSFAMDTDGKIFESETGAAGCSMGEVSGNNLKEITK